MASSSSPPNTFDEEHSAYAASRSSEFVYCASDASQNNVLDQHSDTSDADTKLPLVVLGERGSGKSAMLASWLNKRQQAKSKDEFLFSHFAGCSPRSMQLRHVLFRLATSLRQHFNLREMEVPKTEEVSRAFVFLFRSVFIGPLQIFSLAFCVCLVVVSSNTLTQTPSLLPALPYPYPTPTTRRRAYYSSLYSAFAGP